jgi:two-component system, chemotaxis family, response regulator Rcp1
MPPTRTPEDPAPGPIEILLVQDNPGDARLTRQALRETKVWNRLHVVGTGREARAFLHRGIGYEDKPRPDLILLDLTPPDRTGSELLHAVQSDPELASIPVVGVTASRASSEQPPRLGAHACITKPVDVRQLAQAVASITDLWFTIVKVDTDSSRT